jgi:hypothetical protein
LFQAQQFLPKFCFIPLYFYPCKLNPHTLKYCLNLFNFSWILSKTDSAWHSLSQITLTWCKKSGCFNQDISNLKFSFFSNCWEFIVMIKGLWSKSSIGSLYTKHKGNKSSQLLLAKYLSSLSKVGFSWLLDQVYFPPAYLYQEKF